VDQGVVRFELERLNVLSNGFVQLPVLEKGAAKICLGVRMIRLNLKRFSEMKDCVVHLALLEHDGAEIVVCHPSLRISLNRDLPESFDAGIHRTLAPCEDGEQAQER